MTSDQEAVGLLADAHDTVQHARDNRRIGIYRVAVALSYYAAFYAAQSILAHARSGAKTHAGVLREFWRIAIRDSDFPAEGGTVLRNLFEQRARADYDQAHRRSWADEDAGKSISQAQWFAEEVTAWYSRNAGGVFDRYTAAERQ